jgi:hypothetical protein
VSPTSTRPTKRTSKQSRRSPSPTAPRRRKEASEELLDAERQGPAVRLPVVGRVTLPPAEHLVWYGAVAALTAIELIDWPVAVLVAIGKALADNRHSTTLQNVGEALEQVS